MKNNNTLGCDAMMIFLTRQTHCRHAHTKTPPLVITMMTIWLWWRGGGGINISLLTHWNTCNTTPQRTNLDWVGRLYKVRYHMYAERKLGAKVSANTNTSTHTHTKARVNRARSRSHVCVCLCLTLIWIHYSTITTIIIRAKVTAPSARRLTVLSCGCTRDFSKLWLSSWLCEF